MFEFDSDFISRHGSLIMLFIFASGFALGFTVASTAAYLLCFSKKIVGGGRLEVEGEGEDNSKGIVDVSVDSNGGGNNNKTESYYLSRRDIRKSSRNAIKPGEEPDHTGDFIPIYFKLN